MQPQIRAQLEIPGMEVNKKLLDELEAMGFPRTRAEKALQHADNRSLEAAVNWIFDHEKDLDIDEPEVAVDIDIQSSPEEPEPSGIREEMRIKEQELRDQARKKKEEEEKKREREREKERIRAGKELLQAKRIAEENERKRYLAVQKAANEEEKRAREKILQKLEADKLERRRNLGLPPVKKNPTAENTSAPNVQEKQEKKKPLPAVPYAKAELLGGCLRSLRRNYKDYDAKVQRAFHLLLFYVKNVVNNPHEEKYRRIRLSNPYFNEWIGALIGGVEFLELCGFERSKGNEFLVLPREKTDMAILNSALSVLVFAITTPFFGRFSHPRED
ncbi:hypothetical protein SLA2020_031240 [Shorea laevis]